VRYLPVVLLLVLCFNKTQAQSLLKGTVFNTKKTQPLEGVSVITTAGNGTVTDAMGNYAIMVKQTDSIYFSYLTRATMKYAVSSINVFNNFDIALHVPVTELKEVRVMPRNYKIDSIQNRKDYARVFNFQKPGLNITTPASGAMGVGLDLDELINVFRFKRNRSMLGFQRRLLQEEQDKFIDHRFTKPLVRRLTRLTSPAIDTFMLHYRPTYEFTQFASDYEFGFYILQSFRKYKAGIRPSLFKRKEDFLWEE
jgi:CarboxypepD_reg-like domain